MWTAKTLIRLDAQADLSLRWIHMTFCWFCHEVAHFMTAFSLMFNYNYRLQLGLEVALKFFLWKQEQYTINFRNQFLTLTFQNLSFNINLSKPEEMKKKGLHRCDKL